MRKSAIAVLVGAVALSALAAERAHTVPRLSPATVQKISRGQPRVGPRSRAFVGQEAAKIASSGSFSVAQIRMDIQGAGLGSAGDGDIDAIVQLVLLQASVDAEADLRDQIAGMQATINQKKAAREAAGAAHKNAQALKAQAGADYNRPNAVGLIAAPAYTLDSALASLDERIAADQDDLDSLNELGEIQQLRLQALADQRSKALQLLSNLMKAASDTNADITQNLK